MYSKRSTQQLLNKVTNRVQGNSGPGRNRNIDDDDDGLEAYISSMSKKANVGSAAARKSSIQWDKFGDDDFILAEDEDLKNDDKKAATNKFLKKQPTASEVKPDSSKALANKPAAASVNQPTPQVRNSAVASKLTSVSAALNKAKASQLKSSQTLDNKTKVLDDSDDFDLSNSISLDEDIMNDVKHIRDSRSGAKTGMSQLITDDADDVSEGVGGGGGSRFLKKTPAPAKPDVKQPAPSNTPSTQPSTKAKDLPANKSTKAPQSTPTKVDDDDVSSVASMDDFNLNVMDISALESNIRTEKSKKNQVNTERRDSSKTTSAQQAKRPSRDLHAAVVERPVSSASEVMSDVNTDDTVSEHLDNGRTRKRSSDNEEKLSVSDEDIASVSEHGILANLNILSVDELLLPISDPPSPRSSKHKHHHHQSSTDVPRKSSSTTIAPKSILSTTPRSSRSHVRLSFSNIADKSRDRSPSPEVVSTARGSSQASVVYTDEFEAESVATQSVHTGTSGDDSGSDVESDVSSGSRHTRDDHYSDDFTSEASGSHVSTNRRKVSRASSRDSFTSDANNYTSDFDSASSRSRSPSPSLKYTRKSQKQHQQQVSQSTKCVQTGLELGDLVYQWNSQSWQTLVASYGPSFTDPSPIATHVVSADALEAVTAYSPALLALNDMLRQQLVLTTHFAASQKYLQSFFDDTLTPDYTYTTLADTRQDLMKARPAKLSFKDVLEKEKKKLGLK